MNIFKWLWDKISNAFTTFVKAAIDQLGQKFIVDMKDFAIQVIGGLATTDLSNDAKRKAAFEQIKAEAIKRGLTYKDSIINLLIELAVQQLKNG